MSDEATVRQVLLLLAFLNSDHVDTQFLYVALAEFIPVSNDNYAELSKYIEFMEANSLAKTSDLGDSVRLNEKMRDEIRQYVLFKNIDAKPTQEGLLRTNFSLR